MSAFELRERARRRARGAGSRPCRGSTSATSRSISACRSARRRRSPSGTTPRCSPRAARPTASTIFCDRGRRRRPDRQALPSRRGRSEPGSTPSTSTRACAGAGWGARRCSRSRSERALGAATIRLNVFGGNEVARGLYRSLGYGEEAVQMGEAPSPRPAMFRAVIRSAVDAGVSLPGHAGRRRQGDQAGRVPSRAHAGGRARARRGGHEVIVETGAGSGSQFPDERLRGARGRASPPWTTSGPSRSSCSR